MIVELEYGRGRLQVRMPDACEVTVLRKNPVPVIYSRGLPAEDRGLTGVNVVDSIEDAIARSVEASGDPAVAVIPEGPYVVPRFKAHSG